MRREILGNRKNVFLRTDLACESAAHTDMPTRGVGYREYTSGSCSISELRVTSDEGVKISGRERGRYITVNTGKVWYLDSESLDGVAVTIASELSSFIEALVGSPLSENTIILVAGLGNRFITADALGPETADKVNVTYHATGSRGSILESLNCCRVAAIRPGVLGQTGIEAADMIRGAAECVKPDVIVAIDSLAARSCSRLATTVQLSDSGIHPGSGIGNRRSGITKADIGCPIVALGVPTVVDSSTLVVDALEQAGITEINSSLEGVLTNGKSFFVSLKETDIITESLAGLLSSAINKAFFTDML